MVTLATVKLKDSGYERFTLVVQTNSMVDALLMQAGNNSSAGCNMSMHECS